MWEDDILDQAIAAADREIGIDIAILQREYALKNHKRADAVIKVANGNKKIFAEVKKWAAQNEKAAITQLLAMGPKDQVILIADYVNPNMAERFKKMDLQFIDTAGNAYINQKPIFIYITGKKPEEQIFITKQAMKTGRAFQQTGLKVIYLFLREQELLNAPYRDIAKRAKVALGNIGWIIGDLVNQGYVREEIKTKKRTIERYEDLLNKWVEEYPQKLKPKITLGLFTANEFRREEINLAEFNGLWGGEVAAEKYTHFLTPKDITIYIDKFNARDLIGKERLRKLKRDEAADIRIELNEIFWQEENTDNYYDIKNEFTDPILTYADLMATGDPRNIETARRLYERIID